MPFENPGRGLSGYEWWRAIGSPVHVASPMVDQSELPFREVMRAHGAELCFTPMVHARSFVEDATYRRRHLDWAQDEGPVVVQFAGHDPQTLLEAARVVEAGPRTAVAVDLNCGCPQPIARKGRYGAFLLREPEVMCAAVQAWAQGLQLPCTVKIRLVDEGHRLEAERGLQATCRLVDQLQAAGASAITIHGRNRTMTGKHTGAADWSAIGHLKARLSIPVIANGGIERYEDLERCREMTGVDAVMTSEAVLENPAFFSRRHVPPTRLAREYLHALARCPHPYDFDRVVKAHMQRMLHAPMKRVARYDHLDPPQPPPHAADAPATPHELRGAEPDIGIGSGGERSFQARYAQARADPQGRFAVVAAVSADTALTEHEGPECTGPGDAGLDAALDTAADVVRREDPACPQHPFFCEEHGWNKTHSTEGCRKLEKDRQYSGDAAAPLCAECGGKHSAAKCRVRKEKLKEELKAKDMHSGRSWDSVSGVLAMTTSVHDIYSFIAALESYGEKVLGTPTASASAADIVDVPTLVNGDSWYRRHRSSAPDTDQLRQQRKDSNRMWLQLGVRMNR